jgi:Pyruvate/2-oxoacid:ferredoxin oxidoreductase delta subunit
VPIRSDEESGEFSVKKPTIDEWISRCCAVFAADNGNVLLRASVKTFLDDYKREALDSEREKALSEIYKPLFLDGGNCIACNEQLCYCPERQIVHGEWHENNLTQAIRNLKEKKA